VTAEVALTCALLVAAGLMTKSIVKLGGADYGFETEGLFTARLELPDENYPDRAARQRFWEDLLADLGSLPEIASVALTSQMPMAGGGASPVAIDGVVYENAEALPQLGRAVVSTGYFETLGAPIVAGRDFAPQVAQGSQRVAIVNQSMVDRYLGRANPIGRQFRTGLSDTLPRITVVGVVPDLERPLPGSDDFEPAAYFLPLRQADPRNLGVTARPRSGDPLGITPVIRAAVSRSDPELPIFDVRTEVELIDRRTWFIGVFGRCSSCSGSRRCLWRPWGSTACSRFQ
jgi:hypothetical protein